MGTDPAEDAERPPPIVTGEEDSEALPEHRSRHHRRQRKLQSLDPAETDPLQGDTQLAGTARSRRRPPKAEGGDLLAVPCDEPDTDIVPSSAERRRSNRRRRPDSPAAAALGAAGDVVRSAFDRISPRRRPTEEAGLLALVPDEEDLVSQRAAVPEDAVAPPLDAGTGGGAQGGGGPAVVWVEDAASGTFFRASDRVAAYGGEPTSRRTFFETLGLAPRGGDEGNVRLVILASRAQAVLGAALAVAEGILSGMALLHALVVEQCASRAFLVVSYLPAALQVQQAFQLLTSLAVVSALIAHSRASFKLKRLTTQRAPVLDAAAKHREASYQQAAAGMVAFLYGIALLVALLNIETVWSWSLIDPQSVIDMEADTREQLYVDQFSDAYPLWRVLSILQTSSCVLAWLIANAFYTAQASMADTGISDGRQSSRDTQPSLVASLVASGRMPD